MCAIRNGQSIDTTMGLTPLSGLPGATRAGDVDASLIFHYTSHSPAQMSHDPSLSKEVRVTEVVFLLFGITDFKEITEKADLSTLSDPMSRTEDPNTLALHGDVDALVFAGGVGERSVELRQAIGEAVVCLGFAAIDETKNSQVVEDDGVIVVDIGKGDKGKKMLVCHTDEQVEMARECSLTGEFWV